MSQLVSSNFIRNYHSWIRKCKKYIHTFRDGLQRKWKWGISFQMEILFHIKITKIFKKYLLIYNLQNNIYPVWKKIWKSCKFEYTFCASEYIIQAEKSMNCFCCTVIFFKHLCQIWKKEMIIKLPKVLNTVDLKILQI